jgi:glycosyltransferase involved in cell wall biosynthesis
MISVVMPVYNSAKYLRESIESILNQTFRAFEFIIVDDGSVDNSISIIKSYNDSRIVFIQKPSNSGIADTFNIGIAAAKGKYIARMDSDDISVANRLQLQVKYMEDHPDVLALGGAYVFMDTGIQFNPPLTYDEVKICSIIDMPVANPTIFIRRDIFSAHNWFYDKTFEPAEDFEMVIRFVDMGKVENLSQVLLNYRTHANQSTAIKIQNQINAVERIRINQLHKLTSFVCKPYDELFAIDILRHKDISQNSDTVQKVILLLSDIYNGNAISNFYDEQLLSSYLRSSWLHFIRKLDIPVLKKIKLFLSTRKNATTTMTYYEAFNLIAVPLLKKILNR